MGWFKNKKEVEEVPQLPDLPELPELPDSSNSFSQPMNISSEYLPDVPPGLPEIETKPLKENDLPFLPNQNESSDEERIKQAITQPRKVQNQQTRNYSSPRALNPSISNQMITPDFNLENPRTLEISPLNRSLASPKMTKKIEPIFVRLDKFQMTVQTFEEIKAKIEEIEEVLKKTKEIKVQEEQELVEWEREIQMIKSRIELIDRNVFNKLD